MLEENVVRAAGVNNCTTEEELRRIIRDAGFRPAQRDTLYRTVFPELSLTMKTASNLEAVRHQGYPIKVSLIISLG